MWKDIPGYGDKYEVADWGAVRTKRTGRILTTHLVGYRVYVELWNDGRNHSVLLHRLVADAFVPNPDELPVVHHKDFDVLNNAADNLEWVEKGFRKKCELM